VYQQLQLLLNTLLLLAVAVVVQALLVVGAVLADLELLLALLLPQDQRLRLLWELAVQGLPAAAAKVLLVPILFLAPSPLWVAAAQALVAITAV
jgi:hypothetical protein